jgi:hypothetical protein
MRSTEAPLSRAPSSWRPVSSAALRWVPSPQHSQEVCLEPLSCIIFDGVSRDSRTTSYHQEVLDRKRLRVRPLDWTQEDAVHFVRTLTADSSRSAQSLLFRIMRSSQDATAIANVLRVVRIVLAQNTAWRDILANSLKKRGRCPDHYRRGLRYLLTASLSVATSKQDDIFERKLQQFFRIDPANRQQVTSPSTAQSSHDIPTPSNKVQTLDLSALELGIFDLEKLFSKLNSLPRDAAQIRLKLRDTKIHVYGLAVIATWISSLRLDLNFDEGHPTTEYLKSLGFLDLASVEQSEHMLFDSRRHLGLTFISSNSRFSTDRTVNRFLDLFKPHLFESKEKRAALAITFAELVENAHLHSHCRCGYMIAQIHPTSRKLHLAIADSGIGIRESFHRGDNDAVRLRIVTDEDALRLACEPLITSKTQGHAGYGLYLVSELAQRNVGTFILASGDSLLRRWSRRSFSGSLKPQETVVKHAGWKGTVVGVMFDLNSEIPIDTVYESLPQVRGYSKEDFFA